MNLSLKDVIFAVWVQVRKFGSCLVTFKPEATAARNQNSIGDRTEKKTLGETRLSRGAISPLARRHSSSIPTAAKSDWMAQLVPEVFS